MVALPTRPNLYHAAASTLIEELAVRASARGRRAGNALIRAVLEHAEEFGCAEVSLSTSPSNHRALRVYRSHGLTEEYVLLEKHLQRSSPVIIVDIPSMVSDRSQPRVPSQTRRSALALCGGFGIMLLYGDVAQWQSTGLISRRLLVQIQSSPPSCPEDGSVAPLVGAFF
jgi:hypothetical protein